MASERDILYQAELQKVGKSGNKTSEVVVSENHVRWKEKEETASGKTKESSDAAEVKVRISWILKISVEENSTDTDQSKLCIHHAARNLNKDFTSDLSLAEVTFIGAKETCSKLAELLQNQITKKAPNRPKRLLLIINPVSGKGKGEKIYQHQVAPIFDLSGIKVDVKVTQRAKHSDEILDQYDLSTVDAVIAMGGDGTLTEVASALMRRTAKDAGIDENDPGVTLKTPPITCSMISAGSANGHPLYSGFSKLPTTSALVIAIGHTQSMDVVSIHCGRKLIAYDLLLLGYGQMGRVMSMMENNRWAGPARYLALPFCLLLSRKTIAVEVNLLHAETSGSENQNATEDKPNEGTTDGATAGPAWQTVSGELLSVDMTTINPASPQYHKPFFIQQNLGDGVMNVWLSRPCGRMDQIAFFNKLKKMDHTAFDVDFIDKYAVKAYKVRATGKHSQDSKEAMVLVWDGDMISLPEPHAEIRNHQGVMTIFSRDDGEELRSSHANQPRPA